LRSRSSEYSCLNLEHGFHAKGVAGHSATCAIVLIEGTRERGFGRIINISSVNDQKGQMGQVNYSASKAGDLGFTRALAQENANKGVTVNAICPGYIATEMVMARCPSAASVGPSRGDWAGRVLPEGGVADPIKAFGVSMR
jgi:NAD(P)-dependent dehydrogenase (short-subunit alcohol dehydrogenase family)